jgi:hypothetical protein
MKATLDTWIQNRVRIGMLIRIQQLELTRIRTGSNLGSATLIQAASVGTEV